MSLVLINHPLTAAYQISELTAALGYDVYCQQLDPGPMLGFIRVVLCGDQLFLLISADKPVAIYGSRLKDYAAFGSFLSDFKSDIHCHAHGHKATANWSSSFSPLHDETFCQLAPNVPMLVSYISHASLKACARDWHEAKALDTITYKEFAVFQPEPYERVVKAAMYRLMNPSPDPDYSLSNQFNLLLYDLFNQTSTDARLVQSFKRFDLINDFFKLAIDNQRQPIKIKEVADALYTSNTTLIKGCYEVFGVKPMDVLKNLRLEQAHRAMSQRSVQYELQLHKVDAIAKFYGFESRPHFAKNYQAMYGMTPVESLNASV